MRPFHLRAIALLLLPLSVPAMSQERAAPRYTNLQVLPDTVSRAELVDRMLENLQGLGLPRRQNEGCLFCHVGNMDIPVRDWDFASDDKVTKRKARVMMAMVDAINANHLSRLEGRIDSTLRVTCASCHAGRTDPRPLPDVLRSTWRAAGVDSTIRQYLALRARYEGANAYDFRPRVLAELAAEFADSGHRQDAVRLATVNAETHPGDASADGSLRLLQLEAVLTVRGAEAALASADSMRAAGRDVAWWVIDGLGWRAWRRNQRAPALALFRHNQRRFPEIYQPNESLADALVSSGDRAAGIAIYEEWTRKNPDHDMGRRKLMGLRQP